MSYREYIGARYVPLFADPLEWDSTQSYEPLTVVYHQGNSYTSRQAVPAGIEITNNTYWAQTGNYNAQIEQYRAEVQAYDNRITSNANAITSEATTRASEDADIRSDLGTLIQDNATEINTIKSNGWVTRDRIATAALPTHEKPYFYVCGDSFSVSSRNWVNYFASTVGKTLINMAVSGAAFTKGSGQSNIVNQFNSVINDAHFREAAYIIIYGGVNDYNGTTANITSMRTALQNILSAYNGVSGVKPDIYLCIGNAPYSNIGWAENYPLWVNEVNKAAAGIHFPNVIDNVVSWLLGLKREVFESDQLHPNALGSQYIADFMCKIVNGCYTGVQRTIAVPHEGESGYITCTINNDLVQWDMYVGMSQSQGTSVASNEYVRLSEDNMLGICFINSYTYLPTMMCEGPILLMRNSSSTIGWVRPCVNLLYGNVYAHSEGTRSLLTGLGGGALRGSFSHGINPWNNNRSWS